MAKVGKWQNVDSALNFTGQKPTARQPATARTVLQVHAVITLFKIGCITAEVDKMTVGVPANRLLWTRPVNVSKRRSRTANDRRLKIEATDCGLWTTQRGEVLRKFALTVLGTVHVDMAFHGSVLVPVGMDEVGDKREKTEFR